MTPQQINRAITEHLDCPSYGLLKCGYWYRPNAKGYTGQSSEAWRLSFKEAKKHEYLRGESCEHVIVVQLPDRDFYNDLNACQIMESSLAPWKDFPWNDTYGRYVGWLERVTGVLLHRNTGSQGWKKLISATAPQRCEAFLKSVGKWPLDITQPAS